ncbi:Virulence-associated protein I [Geodia barretti]|uniref:Virulence-associated protein I n=1 Tax=Geodia barretti TaxID=519541 RepID=A0AA35RUV8_GEOBA|nr:Virulence-associated protein I [Geodia barretti]
MEARDRFPPVKDGLPAIHPGEILADELKEIGMSADELDRCLAVPAGTVAAILHEKRGIDADFALRLARYFGAGERLWMNLQTSYDLKIAEGKSGVAIAKQVKPRDDDSPMLKGDLQ